MKKNILIAIVVSLFACSAAMAQRFVHPGIPFTKYDLEQLKTNITKEPWLSAYNAFANDAHSRLSYSPQGPAATVTRAPNLNNTRWINDMVAIRNLAFMWIFTGDSAYARKATNLLDAWAVTNTTWGGNENMLDIGDYADYWGTGAEILRHTFPGWSQANTAHVKNYFTNVLYPTSWVPFALRDANKGALQLKIALAASVFCDDTARFNQAIDVYRMDAGGGMRNSLPNGQVGDAGRDDHWRVQAAALVWGAEVAYKQGIDMYEELDKRVLAIGELYHKFSFEGDTMTFIPFGNYASYWTNWGVPTGIRRGDMTNTIQAAYALRKGIPTPYTDKMRAALGGAGGDFLFLKSSDTSTASPLPPVYYPADHVQPVSNLTNINIGNPGIAGSASYNNGVWTIKAAGNSTSNAFNYTFKKMTGDAGLVVKVNNMSLNSSGCGVMIRQSLAPGAPFWDIYLAATGGVGRHFQPRAPWWLKMERVGNRIFTYHSQDGIHWTSLNCFYSTTYSSDLYYGFYTISNNTSALNTATFTNVGYSQAAPAGSPEISSATNVTASIGAPFNYVITASGNPTAFSATGLPAGLTLDATTGIISGTPTAIAHSEVTISATNSSGTGTATLILNVINNQAPAAPDSVAASIVNSTRIMLSWSTSDNATSYSLKRATVSGGPYTSIQAGITGTNFLDAAPVPEINNYYVVTAHTGNLESPISNEVFASVPPAVPGKPVVSSKNGSVDLVWDTAHGATSYNVKRATISGGPYTTIANVIAHTYTDVNVTNGSPYYYVIAALGATKESANSAEAFAVPGTSSFTWSADPDSVNWNDAANWVEHSVPANPAVITFKASADTVLTNDITGLEASRIQFDTDASQYTIGGNSVTLNNDLVNNSGYSQTIDAPLVLNNMLNVNAGTQNITLSGIVTGTGSLLKSGTTGVLILTGNNTYSSGTIIRGFIPSWPPTNGIIVRGKGTGTLSNPTSGPLGTGKIIFNGGALWADGGDVILYNDVEVPAGQNGWLFQTGGGIFLYSKLTGSGTLFQDGNVTNGLHLYGDNSGFTGQFISKMRSGASRTRFEVPEAGSANANWLLDANAVDCHGLQFRSGTIHFGSLSGRGYIRNNGGGSPAISIGALNKNTNYGGTIGNATGGNVQVEKVGTGTLEMWGNQAYGGTTTVKNGKLLLVNSATTGVFPGPVVDSSGTFGGTGLSQGTFTIGTGTAATAILEPGNNGIGTLTTTNTLTLNSNATYEVEMSFKNGTADKMRAGSIRLVGNPVLLVNNIDSGALASGANFTIIDNTGSGAVAGIFKDLPELSLVKIGNYNFRITYTGGDGNDVVLIDERAMPITIVSAKVDTTLTGKAYSYTIQAIHSPTSFNATGLPAGLNVNTSAGIISGTPAVTGNFAVVLTAANDTASVTDTLRLAVLKTVVENVLAAEGDTKVILEWNSILDLTYNIKRSTSQAGPFTSVGNTAAARFTDTALTNGVTWYYVISAVDGGVEYGETSPVAATPKAGQYSYWKFNDSTGTRAIDSWGARHGILTGGTGSTKGVQDKAVQLNGANGYVALPSGVVSALNDFTIAGWIRIDASSTWSRIFDFGTGTTNYMFLTPVSGNNTIRYAIKVNGGAEQQLNSSLSLGTGEWRHVAVTLSGTAGTLYIDGVAAATNNISAKPSSLGATTQNYIGRSQFSADPYLNAAVDEFRIYNRGLSAAEIKNLYAQYAPALPPTNLVVTSSNGKPALSWAASAGAVSYNVKRATAVAGPYTTIATVDAASYTDTAAASCATYFYVVSANSSNSNLESANSSMGTLLAGKKLTGTLIGTSGSFNNNAATTKTAAVDGSLTSYFDAASANGAWVGYDLGADSTQAVFKIRYAPRPTYGSRMVGGVFQGSNVADFSTAKTLYTIKTAPADGIYTEQSITSTAAYRYIRYLSPNNGFGNVAEFECYGIAASAPQITTKAGTQNVSYGETFSYTITASNTPNNYSVAGLPDGLSLDACTGVISGTLNATGTFPVIFTASNAWGSVNDTLVLNVCLPVTANIPDVYAMNPAVDAKNTIYLGYGPTSVAISQDVSGGTSPYVYLWSNEQTTSSISVSAAGTYSVTVTDSKGCATAASITINVLDVRCGNNNDKVMVCHNNNTICVASAAVQEHLDHGDHLGGCSSNATARTAEQQSQIQIENSGGVVVYPNPAYDNISIKLSRLQQGAMFVLFDANGRIVLSDRMTNTTQTISMRSLAPGVYYVQIRNGKESTTHKILKQ